MKRVALLFFSFLFVSGLMAQIQPASEAKLVEMPVYTYDGSHIGVSLRMSYASARIENPDAMSLWKGLDIARVDLIFSKYPHDLDNWIINYETLLQRRLRALKELDESLLTDPDIEWNYVLQTNCENEAEAKDLFHGFIVYVGDGGGKMSEVERIVHQQKELADSTAYLVLERHPEWKNKLIVMDWTGSMYPYGASVLLWHTLNLSENTVSNFVFFNDGNEKRTKQKKIGKTGGIFLARTNELDTVLSKMNEVMNRGGGGDGPENDIEALLKATQRLKNYEEVVLIADNRSEVRDLKLVKHLKKPVKVILCGVDEENPIHSDYLTLARLSGGSVHTIEKDIRNLMKVKEGQTIRLDGNSYRVQGGRFVRLDRS
jgi:hypothetical protein